MKKINLSTDEPLIEAARERARPEHTALDEQFLSGLADYAQAQQRLRRCDEVVSQLRGKLQVGCKLGREEMSER